MPVALEQFVKQLEDSGVISSGKLAKYLPPKAHPKDAQELARELVRQKHLTKFQAQEIYQGRAKSLILGNYTILDRIGAGGMGQVFKAEHRRMKRIVAIKMLPRNVTKDAAAVARFQREVEAAARLSHANIVAAYDADEAGGVHFLAMEYVEGSDLSALVKKNGRLPVAKAVNYVLQAARGLEFAHAEGVVHRDIKPANLLLDKKGVVKILDMGLARIDPGGAAAAQAELTGTGAVLGTIDYMAPEQALSAKHVDARADIYSLGCTLHYLLVGKAVYGGDTLMARLLAHRENPIPSLGAGVPEQVEAVFRKMVAKSIEDRYQTMSQVVADLEQCGSGQPESLSIQQPAGTEFDNSALTFLRDIPALTTQKPQGKPTGPLSLWERVRVRAGRNKLILAAAAAAGRKKLILGAAGAAVLGIVILAAVVLKLRTKEGTLLVEVDQPDATVQVLSEEGKVEISRPGEKGTLTIAVDPGRHRLKVTKDGFQFYVKDFQVEPGGKRTIRATLLPERYSIVPPSPPKPTTNLDDPAFERWMKGVAALPAEKQVEAVVKKLQELNPGFDGKETHQIDGGAVTELQFISDNVADISPVRALQRLKSLECNGSSYDKGKLSDLSPLGGMPLTGLRFQNTRVSDLSPLKGMPLVSLNCGGARVLGLSPLQGAPLRWLAFDNTRVSDLSPLRGMPLAEVWCDHTQVSDLSPLEGCDKLGHLDLQGTKVTAAVVAALQKALPECRIEWDGPASGPGRKPITTFNEPAFQQWMKGVAALPAEKQVEAVVKKLQELNPGFDGKETHQIEGGAVTELKFITDNVTDISPVRALGGLRNLYCQGTYNQRRLGRVSDLSPLQGMRLETLSCGLNPVSDLSPLRGMPLTRIWCGSTTVLDLSPLKGMPLTDLYCHWTRVSDLSPLKGMPLTELYCDGAPVFDLTPLEGVNLRVLCFTAKNITRGIGVIRQMKSLKTIGVGYGDKDKFPPAEFWKKYDARDFGKPTTNLDDPAFERWMKGVAALPAEKQVEAVVKKLQDLNPGFDGKETHKIEDGVVTELKFISDNVADLSPVLALQRLKGLDCPGSFPIKGRVSDLSPLKGMPLMHLACYCTYVPDLSPLRGMPLTYLDCGDTQVSDLSPLRGMPLTCLHCGRAHVSDLSPLKGMPLTFLDCSGTGVSDLSPLRGMPLAALGCDGTSVSDLSPLEGCDKLRTLKLQGTKVTAAGVAALQKALPECKIEWDDPAKAATPPKVSATNVNDPAFQQWMRGVAALPTEKQVEAVIKKLQELNPGFDGKETHKIEGGVVTEFAFITDNVTDISPVRALQRLKTLDCYGSSYGKGKLSDLSPLRGLLLTAVNCGNTQASDPSPLEGMLLAGLNCCGTRISDLSPLKGMPLAYLDCSGTSVSSLSPLRGMPMAHLYCGNTLVSDLSPLEACGKLRTLHIQSTKVTAAGVAALQRALPECKIKWDDPAKATPPPKVSTTNLDDPAFRQWMRDVAALPAEKQVEAVVKKLQELNPGFDGKETHKIEGGAVTELRFITDNVTDMWPVRALQQLKKVECYGSITPGSSAKGKACDLSPLKGLPLIFLDCGATQVSDLSPLQGMPLTFLVCLSTRVCDLSPLKGMPLAGLSCARTQVSDLSPLKGMHLAELQFDGTRVSDLSALKGMSLAILSCAATGVSDLSPLKGMPLTFLNCDATQVSDLSQLKGMPLTRLSCSGTQVADLSPLRGMPLTSLGCASSQVSDLAPLRGMPLRELYCNGTGVSDLSPLEGCDKLRTLGLHGAKVTAAAVAALKKALPECKIEWPVEGQFYAPRPASAGTK